MKRFLLLFVGLTLLFTGRAQLSQNAQASVITCGPGAELYSGFGHSALRIYDPEKNIDIVYNYGMFDFEADDFYIKFARGKLAYWLGKSSMMGFIQSYIMEERSVKEQVLSLEPEEVSQMYAFLENNALEENRYYAYDFFFDNCATRPRDVLENVLSKNLKWHEHADAGKVSFRDIIDRYLERSPWVDLGIDLILGSVIDRKATNAELMFLPDYVFQIVEKSTINRNGVDVPLVRETVVHYDPGPHALPDSPDFIPDYLFYGIFAIVLGFTLFKFSKPLIVLDVLVFLITGLLGVFILLMWFGTEHQATAANLNVIWSNPLHLFTIVLLFLKPKKWFVKYYLIMAIVTGALLFLDPILPQDFNSAIKPLILVLAMRYFTLWKWSKKRVSV